MVIETKSTALYKLDKHSKLYLQFIYTLFKVLSIKPCTCGCLSLTILFDYCNNGKENKDLVSRAGDMAQRLRALAFLPEVLSSSPSNHL